MDTDMYTSSSYMTTAIGLDTKSILLHHLGGGGGGGGGMVKLPTMGFETTASHAMQHSAFTFLSSSPFFFFFFLSLVLYWSVSSGTDN